MLLERGGDRLYFDGEAGLAVYHRKTGALIGAARIEDGVKSVFGPGATSLDHRGAGALPVEPGDRELRTRAIEWARDGPPGVAGCAAAALEFADGRLALVDLEVLRASMTAGRRRR